MVGVARGVTVMPVKVLDCKGGGNSFALAQGILYAVQNGASVLNVSLGAPVEPEYLHEAIRIAHDEYGVLLVAATGNTGGDVAFPARYPEVLAVGAESASHPGQHASFSGAGPEVDVVAVGQGILGTVPDGACSALLVVPRGRRYPRHRLRHVLRGAAGHGTRCAHAVAQPLPDSRTRS